MYILCIDDWKNENGKNSKKMNMYTKKNNEYVKKMYKGMVTENKWKQIKKINIKNEDVCLVFVCTLCLFLLASVDLEPHRWGLQTKTHLNLIGMWDTAPFYYDKLI